MKIDNNKINHLLWTKMVVTYWGMYWGLNLDENIKYIITPIINRPYSHETDLIIGCGAIYQHDHFNQYTIDIDPWAEPCLIASFGKDHLTDVLPKGVFHHIIFEGVFIPERDQGCVFESLMHLLSSDGDVSFTYGYNYNFKVTCIAHKFDDKLLKGDNGKIIHNEITFYEWLYEIIYK